jgi:hypothetical protein
LSSSDLDVLAVDLLKAPLSDASLDEVSATGKIDPIKNTNGIAYLWI